MAIPNDNHKAERKRNSLSQELKAEVSLFVISIPVSKPFDPINHPLIPPDKGTSTNRPKAILRKN